MLFILGLWLALLLDWWLGDPRWLPHPVRLIGRACERLEVLSRRAIDSPVRAGIVTAVVVLAGTGLSCLLLFSCLAAVSNVALFCGAVLVLYTTLATKDLTVHGLAVYEALEHSGGDYFLARQRVGMMVGRDTRKLDLGGIVRACVESLAENMSDGVVAPLFWAWVGAMVVEDSAWSLPSAATGAMLYKATNTMDSMFGYKNERYLQFGRFAARFDDLANMIPARLTGLAIALVTPLMGERFLGAWKILVRDRHRHASPNAGYPEAAMAGALGIRLGGSNIYFGQIVEKPFIGEPLSPPEAAHILRAIRLLVAASGFTGFLFTTGYVFFR